MSNEAEVIKPQLHHWGIRTLQFQEMLDWYTKVVGFEVVLAAESPVQSAFVTNDDAHHRGGFFQFPGIQPHPEGSLPPAVNHLAFEFDSLEDLLSSWERIKAEGIEPLMCTDHGPTFAFYYKDPDNHTVELLCDAAEDPGAVMRDPALTANPMGHFVDPAKLLEALRSGLSPSEIHERALADEYAPAQPGNPLVLA